MLADPANARVAGEAVARIGRVASSAGENAGQGELLGAVGERIGHGVSILIEDHKQKGRADL